MRYSWPYCQKCKQGVVRVERRQGLFNGHVVYMVYCHGQRRDQVVNGLDLHDTTMIATSEY